MAEILIIEDDKAIQNLLKLALKKRAMRSSMLITLRKVLSRLR